MATGTILALGGGGFSTGPEDRALDDLLLSLVTRRRGAGGRPKVCFLPTASGDAPGYCASFSEAFAGRAETSVLRLSAPAELGGRSVRDHLLAHDVVYVGGGSTVELLARWREHGVDEALREAAAAGVVLGGVSAGMSCWFEASLARTADGLVALADGLGLLPGSACPHADAEPDRWPTYLDLVGRGELPAGYAADDGCALLFRDGQLVEAVAARPGARAHRVERVAPGPGTPSGGAVMRRLEARAIR